MLNWIIEIATIAIGALCLVAFLYGLLNSRQPRPPQRPLGRDDRRDPSRHDRRREDLGPPTESERRVASRRTADRNGSP